MIDQLLNSATFGFGASFGRDLYKAAKKNPIVWAVIGIALIAVGWRGFYMGIGRGGAYKFFVTFLGSLIMVIVGTGAFLALGAAYSTPESNAPMMIALGVIVVSTIGGNLWGRAARRGKKRALELKAHNAAFLEEVGISDSDFDTNLLQDSEGNLLKLTEQTEDKIVFSVSGRRGLRAAIKLDQGRMVDYTGIVKI